MQIRKGVKSWKSWYKEWIQLRRTGTIVNTLLPYIPRSFRWWVLERMCYNLNWVTTSEKSLIQNSTTNYGIRSDIECSHRTSETNEVSSVRVFKWFQDPYNMSIMSVLEFYPNQLYVCPNRNRGSGVPWTHLTSLAWTLRRSLTRGHRFGRCCSEVSCLTVSQTTTTRSLMRYWSALTSLTDETIRNYVNQMCTTWTETARTPMLLIVMNVYLGIATPRESSPLHLLRHDYPVRTLGQACCRSNVLVDVWQLWPVCIEWGWCRRGPARRGTRCVTVRNRRLLSQNRGHKDILPQWCSLCAGLRHLCFELCSARRL